MFGIIVSLRVRDLIKNLGFKVFFKHLIVIQLIQTFFRTQRSVNLSIMLTTEPLTYAISVT